MKEKTAKFFDGRTVKRFSGLMLKNSRMSSLRGLPASGVERIRLWRMSDVAISFPFCSYHITKHGVWHLQAKLEGGPAHIIIRIRIYEIEHKDLSFNKCNITLPGGLDKARNEVLREYRIGFLLLW